jgi:hypothetical protein
MTQSTDMCAHHKEGDCLSHATSGDQPILMQAASRKTQLAFAEVTTQQRRWTPQYRGAFDIL